MYPGSFQSILYCNKWRLTVNVDKTKILVFRKEGRLPQNSRWLYNGHKLEVVSSFDYLGVVFSSGGVIQESYKYSFW